MVSFRVVFFLIIFAASYIPFVSADGSIIDFQIRASEPPHDRYTDIDTITFSWETSQTSDAVLEINEYTYAFYNQTSFEKNIGQFSASTAIYYSLYVFDSVSDNLTDDRDGSISIESGAPQISVDVVGEIESDVTLVWQDTVKRTLTVEVENEGKQTGEEVSYSYTGDTTLESWLDKTQGAVSVSGYSEETVTFTVSVPHTAAEGEYRGKITFWYEGIPEYIQITITVSQPPATLKADDLNLGDVKVGSTYTESLTISEVGHYKKLTISGVTAKGRLTLVGSYPHEIAAGGSGTINLKLKLPDEAMSSKRYSDDVVITTNVGTKTAEVKYEIPFPELSIYSDKNSHEVPLKPGSSSEISIPLSVKESGGYNHLKDIRLAYKWISYPGKNPDILDYFDVDLSGDSFSLIKRGDDKTANLHITVQGTAPRGVYTMQVSGTASNNNGRVSVEEIEISNVPQCLIDAVQNLEGLKTGSDNQREIRTETLSLINKIKQEYNRYTEDVKVACGLGDDAYEFINLIVNIKYPTSIEKSKETADTVRTLHTKYNSLMDNLKHFKDKNLIGLDYGTIEDEEMAAVNNIVSHIKQIEPETLCEERSKYQNIKEIYTTIGLKNQADEYDEEIVRVNQEIDDNKTIAKSYEDEACKYAEEFKKTSGIGFVLHYSDCRETYGDAIKQYGSAKSTYEYIGSDCKSDYDRVNDDIGEIMNRFDQLEKFRSTTIFLSMFIFGLLLINAIGVERRRIPERRIEERCRKLWR